MEVVTKAPPALYVIGDRGSFRHDKDWLDALERVADALLEYPNAALQIRAKGSSPQTQFRRMKMARKRLETPLQNGLRTFVNGTVVQAIELGYPGAHLKESRIQSQVERPAQLELATSTHSLESVRLSAQIGASFCVFGPVFVPKSKSIPAVGLPALAHVAAQTSLHVLALGGMTPARVPACLQAGARGIACITSVMRSENPKKRIGQFMKAVAVA